MLLYVTGGLAYGEVKSNTVITQRLVGPGTPTVDGLNGSNAGISKVRAGWALGAGGEWRFASHWSAKIEYLHYDLGRVSYTGTYSNIVTPPGGAVPTGSPFYTLSATSSVRFSGDLVRVGLNYLF
jgi:outer membrane immunogenic protein